MNVSEQPFYFRVTIQLLLVGLIVAFMILAKNILIPFTIAVVFTFLLLPVSNKLQQWRFPKVVAILINIVLALSVFFALIYFFYSQVVSFVNDWPVLKETMTAKWVSFQQFISETFHVSQLEQQVWLKAKIQENVDTGGVLVMGIFSATGTFLASFALIPIYIFFLSFYQDKFKEFVKLIAKENNHEQALLVVKKVSVVSQKYLVGIFLDVLILSILNSTGFLILGLPHAILFGVLASMLNIIPYIGVMIGSILPITMAFLTKDAMSYPLAVAGICFFVQFLDNNFITPFVVGSSVSINPLTATLVLISSAIIWGIPGMILCMPLTGMAKVVCDNIDSLKPYGFLLGEEVNYTKQEHIQDKIVKRFRKPIKKNEDSADTEL